jgi:hypothetical protein
MLNETSIDCKAEFPKAIHERIGRSASVSILQDSNQPGPNRLTDDLRSVELTQTTLDLHDPGNLATRHFDDEKFPNLRVHISDSACSDPGGVDAVPEFRTDPFAGFTACRVESPEA